MDPFVEGELTKILQTYQARIKYYCLQKLRFLVLCMNRIQILKCSSKYVFKAAAISKKN